MDLPLGDKVGGADDDVVARLDHDGHLAATGGLEDTHEQAQRVLQHIRRTHVDLGDHYEHGH